MKTVSKKLFSLLLVAALLISAVPVMAFADGEADNEIVALNDEDGAVKHTTNHVMGEYTDNGDGKTHSQTCTVAGCEKVETNTHTYEKGKCYYCDYVCTHENTKEKNAVAPGCTTPGKEADEVCEDCGLVLVTGESLPAVGHEDADGDGKCDACQAKVNSDTDEEWTLNLDPNGGTINGMTSGSIKVTSNKAISKLPTPVRSGYTFAGWFMEDGTKIYNGMKFQGDWGDGATATAKWSEVTYKLTVVRLLNGDTKTAKNIYDEQVAEGVSVLDYLKTNVSAKVEAEAAKTPGYVWADGYWKNYSGKQALTSQTDKMDQARTIYVNFKAESYTLNFNANGGNITNNVTSKSVTYGKAVGTLPTVKCEGKVFQGWVDEAGVIYTKDTVYNVEGDTILTAAWKDEALVLLYIYANSKFTDAPIVVVMDGYITNNNVQRADVETIVKRFYTGANGNGLSIAGLFTEDTWASYKKNTSKAGTPTVQVLDEHPMKVYVNVTNAKLSGGGTGTGTGTGTGSGTGSSTNPKTGDTAMLGTAASVMVLAAAGFVTMQAMRKKKEF